ncbi:GRAM domain-containing protein 2A isoform X12 [Mustela lutreola]|uniref:GRAM domain-containing protein 2A isoform X12 n=1 Tax=Mustela lutreola TaxID=9666 RepID=UPI002796FDCE|nr:GRAM domain-containing protein 2A isoform X12 [Mustela lutreola]
MAQESEPFTAAQSGGAPLSRACGRARARPCFRRSQIWASYQVGCWTPIPNGTSDEGALGSFFRRGREVHSRQHLPSRWLPLCPGFRAHRPIRRLGWAGRRDPWHRAAASGSWRSLWGWNSGCGRPLAPGDPGLPSPCRGRRRKWTVPLGLQLARQGWRSGSDQQMRGKTASLKSSVSCSEKLARVQAPLDSSLHWPEGLKGEEIKKCGREGTLLSKYNQQYHKLFKDIPLEEVVLKVCSCALQRDLLLQGRLYISPNWLCFHASLFGKDIKVVIPVVSVQMIKKHKMARLLPNGLAITTNTSQKYVFVSLLSRDSVYDMLRRVCTHLQPSSKKSLSVREFPEEPECESLVRAEEVLIPEMKWRKVCPASRSLSLPDNIPCIPRASMDSTDSFFPRKPPGSENDVCEEEKLEEEPRSDGKLRLWDYQLLKVIFVLICFLVMSSSYLAFRISRLEQQLCSLNWDGPVPGHR